MLSLSLHPPFLSHKPHHHRHPSLPLPSPPPPPLPHRHHRHHRHRHRHLQITAIDAAQPYDYESKLIDQYTTTSQTNKLKIAIIGFGNYGQFLAKTFVKQGHTILATSRSDHSAAATLLGVHFFLDPHDLCEQHPDIVLLATSITSTKSSLHHLPLQRLKRNTLFVDVLSVKEFPKNLFLSTLPSNFDIICTHPMFGPQSAKLSWSGLPFMYEKVRIFDYDERRVSRCERFLSVFESEGCRMVEMGCEEHDLRAAGSQFLTHTIGRVLKELGLESTPINTKGYESLLELVEITEADSDDLYFGLFLYNQNAVGLFESLILACEEVRRELFEDLHELVRRQEFGGGVEEEEEEVVVVEKEVGSQNGVALVKFSSSGIRRSLDVKATLFNLVNNGSKLKIAIVGFGNFGQFLAKTFVRQGHTVLAYSRSNYSDVAGQLGVSFFSNVDDLCEEHPEVVLLCSSIISAEKVLMSLPFSRLKRNTLFVDVLSVKEFPKNLFLQNLPWEFDILCTHPMFGPESGKNGWKDLPFVYEKVRIGNDESRVSRCSQFLDIFAREGCRIVEMSCEEHDRNAAGSQFITHTMGRILEKLGLESTLINTKGYETLLKLRDNTCRDSLDLYKGLFIYNVNAIEQQRRLTMAFESIKKKLYGQLHGIIRKQKFKKVEKCQTFQEKPVSENKDQNDAALAISSDTVEVQEN